MITTIVVLEFKARPILGAIECPDVQAILGYKFAQRAWQVHGNE
jgi:hypothetical protein